MDIVSTLRQGFAVIPDVFDLAEVDRIAELLAGYESVGTRCLLDCPWCQETAGVLRERLNVSIPELQLLCSVQCSVTWGLVGAGVQRFDSQLRWPV